MKLPLSTRFLQSLAAAALLSLSSVASAAICQFNQTSGAWNVPANWNNCSGGNGVPAGTPGSADRAEIGPAQTVTLPSGTTTVGDIYLQSSTIQGAGVFTHTLAIVGGGTIAGASGSYNFQDMSLTITAPSPMFAIAGTWNLNNAQMTLNPGSVLHLGVVTVAGASASMTNLGDFFAEGNLTFTGGAQFNNGASGIFKLTGAQTFTGPFVNNGHVNVESGRTLTFAVGSTFSQNAVNAAIEGDGTVVATGSFNIGVGSFVKGNLTFNVGTLNVNGAIVPGGPTASGTINVTGDFTMSALSEMFIDIAGLTPIIDRVVVTGAATLAGTVHFLPIDTGSGLYMPSPGDSLDFVQSLTSSLGGAFSSVDFLAFPPSPPGPALNVGQTVEFARFVVTALLGPSVINTNDSGLGSLRQAILDFNTCDFAGLDITFDLTVAGGTISPLTPLPPITCPLNIRGYSNPGAVLNTSSTDWNAVLKVTLDGSMCPGCTGITLNAASGPPGSIIEGINFTNWNTAIRNNMGANDTLIAGNYFFQSGTALDIVAGQRVEVGSSFDPLFRNVFVHSTGDAISIGAGEGIDPPKIENNLIGAGAGLSPGANLTGVRIGTNGVRVYENIIVNNGKGIVVASGTGNDFAIDNKIYNNTTIGIDLNNDGATLNDAGDADSGPNSLVNFPTITSASSSGGNLIVNYTLDTSFLTDVDVAVCITNQVAAQNQCERIVDVLPTTTPSVSALTGTFTIPLASPPRGGGAIVLPAKVTMFTTLRNGPNAGSTSEFSPAVVVAPAAITLTPASITIPATPIGWTRSDFVNANNTTGAPISVTSNTVTGDPSLITATTGPDASCPSSINPGGNCGYGATFIPTVVGVVTGTLPIVTSAGTFNVPVSATGATAIPPPTASVASLNFPATAVGSASATQTITFTNPVGGLSAVNIPNGYFFQAGDSASFTVQSSTCGGLNTAGPSLGLGATCTLVIAFAPQGPAGAKTVPISVQFDSGLGYSLQYNIPLTGSALAGAPALTPSGTLTFGPVLVSTSSAVQPITITNSGAATLTITSMTNNNFAEFKDTTGGPAPNAAHYCGIGSLASGAPATGGPINIAPAATCVMNIVFSPSAPGVRAANIDIISNAPGSPHTVALSGTGVAPAGISVTPAFAPGSVVAGTNATLTLTFSNSNASPASITLGSAINVPGLTLSGLATTCASLFPTVGVGTIDLGMSGTIPPSGSCTVTAQAQSAVAASYPVTVSPGNVSTTLGANVNTTTATLIVTLPAPVITSAITASNTVGSAFSYTIIATNTPTSYNATGLPASLTINTATGVISGTVAAAGIYPIMISATNGGGTGSATLTLTATAAAAPAVTLSATTVPFGNQTVNTTSPVTPITLTNSGAAGLVISSITGTGDFGFTSTCPISTPPVAPTGTCTISITFTPLTVAALSGTVSIASNAPGSPHVISLSGTGAAVAVPGITLSATTLNLGSITVGTVSGQQSIVVTNSGFATLNLTSITVGAPFTRVVPTGPTPPNCGATLAPAATCRIAVTFGSPTQGSFSGQISIVHNAAGSPTTVTLSGIATPVPVAIISLPSAVDFGTTVINGNGNTRFFNIFNTGTIPMSVSSITVSGPNAADFIVDTQLCASPGSIIAAGDTCTVDMNFLPTTTGAKTAQVNVVSNASNGATVNRVDLTGTGILSPRAIPEFSLTTIGFGNVIYGSSASNTVTLKNSGGVPLDITSLQSTSRDFTVTSNCGASLASLSSCVVSVSFSPLGLGGRSGTLRLLSDAATSPPVSLSGTGCRYFSPAAARFFTTNC